MTHNAANERIKRAYFTYLREAKRYHEDTVDQAAQALAQFEADTGFRDFKSFRIEQAVAFKKRLNATVSQATGKCKPFLFAMEEPELHIPPGIQRRLVAQAISISEQTICTSHSPRVAACYPATSVQMLDRRPEQLAATPLVTRPLGAAASNAMRKLCHDDRTRVIEALMHHRVLIPEGRSEYEWFRLLDEKLENSEHAWQATFPGAPSFGTVVGVVPTHDSAVAETFSALRRLRSGIVPVVDGDDAGNTKVVELLTSAPCPELILQWCEGWTIEDAIGWILRGAEGDALGELQGRIDREFTDIAALMALFKVGTGSGRLKTDYLTYEEVASVVGSDSGCRQRASALLNAVTRACLGQYDGNVLIARDGAKSNAQCVVCRLLP